MQQTQDLVEESKDQTYAQSKITEKSILDRENNIVQELLDASIAKDTKRVIATL